MNDKYFSIALIVIFGLSGLALLAAALSMPFEHADRLTACIVGVIGVGFAVIRALMLRHEKQAESVIPNVIEVHSSNDVERVRH